MKYRLDVVDEENMKVGSIGMFETEADLKKWAEKNDDILARINKFVDAYLEKK